MYYIKKSTYYFTLYIFVAFKNMKYLHEPSKSTKIKSVYNTHRKTIFLY